MTLYVLQNLYILIVRSSSAVIISSVHVSISDDENREGIYVHDVLRATASIITLAAYADVSSFFPAASR